MRSRFSRSALIATALLAACDALSPDVVVGERVPPPAPTSDAPVAAPTWEYADPIPAPVDVPVRMEFRRPDVNLRLLDVEGLPRTWVPGRARRLAVTVLNDGSVRSPSTSIRLSLVTRADWVEDVEVETLILDGIAPGAAALVEGLIEACAR
mgnify:CR=1 FL=1